MYYPLNLSSMKHAYHPRAVNNVSIIWGSFNVEILNKLLSRGWRGFHGIQPSIGANIIKLSGLFPRNGYILARGKRSSWLWVRQQIRMDAKSWLVYWCRISKHGRWMIWLHVHWIQITCQVVLKVEILFNTYSPLTKHKFQHLIQHFLPNPFINEKPPLQCFLVTAAGKAVHQA